MITLSGPSNPGLGRILCCALAGMLGACTTGGEPPRDVPAAASAVAPDPLNARYVLEGEAVQLQQGRAETGGIAGSASRLVTSVVGEPLSGDLDGDGVEDAALILAAGFGGSGTFYYAAAARRVDGGYRGSNGLLLGDRIRIGELSIRSGLLVVRYLEHGANQPMAAAPTYARTAVLALDNGGLVERARFGGREKLQEGWLVIGHEVRSFTPCGQGTEHWLLGDSPAMRPIQAEYRRNDPGGRPYRPLFATLAGYAAEPPAQGFGADYRAAMVATHLFGIRPGRACPGAVKSRQRIK